MSPSRKIIAEFVGVFFIGALAGGLVTWRVTDGQMTESQISAAMNRWNNPDKLVERINQKYADEFHLTPDEMAKVQPLVRQLAQDVYKIRHQFGLDILATLDRDHEAIAAQLTPEHRAVYEAKMADRHKELNALLLGDQGSPSPAGK